MNGTSAPRFGTGRALPGARALALLGLALLSSACGGAIAPPYAATTDAMPGAAPSFAAEAPPTEPASTDSAAELAYAGEEVSGAIRTSEAAAATGTSSTPPRLPPSRLDTPPTQTGSSTPPPTESPAPSAAESSEAVKPLLIYSANLQLAVFETRVTLDAAEKYAKEHGGYLVRRDNTSITLRIPAERFDASLDALAKLGDQLHREVNVRDVTEEYFDLSTRLRNYEVVRRRLEELLQRAAKVDEALAVERELTRVTQEIERIKGKLKLYRELVAFSTITLTLQSRRSEQVGPNVPMPFPWLRELSLGRLLSL